MRFRCLVIALAFVAAFASDSWGKSKRAPQPQTQYTQQQTPPEQRGTEKSPVVVKVLPTQEADEKAKADAKEHDENRQFNRDTIWLSKATLVVIFLQLLIFGAQAYFLWGTLNATADAAKAAIVAAEHIPIVERAYLFTTVKPVNLGVILTEYSKMTDNNLKERIGSNLVVDFSIQNEGKTLAIIRSVSAQMFHYKTLPDEPGYGAPLDLPKNRYLAPGKEIDPSIMVDMLAPTYSTIGMLMRAESALWFYGRVTYDDIFGVTHEHRFCWRYSSGYILPYYRNESHAKDT